MTTVFVVLAVVLGLLFGALLFAAGIFCWYLLKTMREFKCSIEQFTRAVDPLIKTGALQHLAGAASQSLDIGRQILSAMKAINVTVALFNKAFFSKEAIARSAAPETEDDFAGKDDSVRFGYSEEGAALRERQEALRKGGIETDHTRIQEPGPENMTGSAV